MLNPHVKTKSRHDSFKRDSKKELSVYLALKVCWAATKAELVKQAFVKKGNIKKCFTFLQIALEIVGP